MRCDDILETPNRRKKITMSKKNYTELKELKSFDERFDYLKLVGSIGIETFGFDRYLNQSFYTSREWKQVRREVIVRDESCDLGILDRPIFGAVRVHHMNPVSVEDLELGRDIILDPEFLICVSHNTHNAIHFGNKKSIVSLPTERKKGDTTLWKVS